MAQVNIVVPELSESVVEATVGEWLKNEGDAVKAGETLVVLETDKVSLDVTAPQDGVVTKIAFPAGSDVTAGTVLGSIDTTDTTDTTTPDAGGEAQAAAAPAGVAAAPAARQSDAAPTATPVARRVAAANNVDLAQVGGSSGKITKTDVQNFLAGGQNTPAAAAPQPAAPKTAPTKSASAPAVNGASARREERVRMTRRRQTIAVRLVEAQHTAAMLTTFNEIDMSAVMDMRKRRRDSFKEKHGIGLGFSSFFVKAVVGALKAFTYLNAEIDGTDIILKHYYDIGIAIGAAEGLVVPVIRDADRLSFAAIETAIRDYAKQTEDGKLSIESLMGGTFTITNGGVFGSMMSTPILNPPQVGILGLHAIKERAVVVNGEIVIRPMMYVALSYDHRIVDGREAVQFLVRVKELIEDPETLLLEG